VYAALAKFGAPIEGLSAKDFAEPDNFFRMGTPPVMVDIMPKISGVEFEEAWRRRVDVRIDDDCPYHLSRERTCWLQSSRRVEHRICGREDWLKLRQHTRENSRDPQDRSAEKDQDAGPKDLSGSPDKGLDDDVN